MSTKCIVCFRALYIWNEQHLSADGDCTVDVVGRRNCSRPTASPTGSQVSDGFFVRWDTFIVINGTLLIGLLYSRNIRNDKLCNRIACFIFHLTITFPTQFFKIIFLSFIKFPKVSRLLAPPTLCNRNKQNKKLSYRRGTARRSMLVSSCYVSRGMAVRKIPISKSDLQGHPRTVALVPFDRPHTISY